MDYTFPTIKHINDVLPAIKGRDEFIVVQKDGYQVVNYAVMMEDSFPPVNTVQLVQNWDVSEPIYETANDHFAAIRRECRGLVFDLDGNIINRRYHKFFNVNERDETRFENIDFTKPHVILEKLDGSMVSPCYVNGNIRWMTKMGITDTSMEAEVFVAANPIYVELAEYCLKKGFTPVFEWCSNKNRIVLSYPEDRLVLTAVRDNIPGDYLLQDSLEYINERFGIEIVKAYDYQDSNILDIVRNMEGTEGVVIRFDSGHMLKVKSDWYVLRHKSKDAITREKNVIEYIINERVDDVLPFLQAEDQHRLMQFQTKFWEGVGETVRQYEEYIDTIRAVDRRTWAMEYMPEQNKRDPYLSNIVFSWYDGKDTKSVVTNIIAKNSNTSTKLDTVRKLWGNHSWEYIFEGDQE